MMHARFTIIVVNKCFGKSIGSMIKPLRNPVLSEEKGREGGC
jgi:hypothetical protein